LRLTNSAIPGPKPKLFVTSAIHAREYTTAPLIVRFAEYLTDNYWHRRRCHLDFWIITKST